MRFGPRTPKANPIAPDVPKSAARESSTGGECSEVLTRTDVEAEPDDQNQNQEQQFKGGDRLNLGWLPEVTCDRLEQKREHHEGEAKEPDAASERMG
jgi:hypothetical protein